MNLKQECYPNDSQVFEGNDGGETVTCTVPSMGGHGNRSWVCQERAGVGYGHLGILALTPFFLSHCVHNHVSGYELSFANPSHSS